MKNNLLFFALSCLLFVSHNASAFNYVRPVSLQNNHDLISDYQIKIIFNSNSLISQGKMKSDCSDMRFLDIDNKTVIPHWIESGCNEIYTNVWVRVPKIPAYSLAYIYLIYGDKLALDTGNPDGVFDLFDHFKGSTLDASKWALERNDGFTYYVGNDRLYVRGYTTAFPLGRFIVNSNYLFNRSVEIEFSMSKGSNLEAQIGHLVNADRMYVAGSSGLDWTAQTWFTSMFERYIYGQGAAGCEVGHLDYCYPTSGTGRYIPVGNGWIDSFGQRMGPRAETLGIGVINPSGSTAYYENDFWIDWIRVRAYTPYIPAYYVDNEASYAGIPVVPPTAGCASSAALQAQLDSAMLTISTQQSKINSLNTQVTTLSSQVTTLQSQNAALQNQVTLLQAQNATLTQQNTNLQNQVTALQAQNATLITQNANLQSQVATLQVQNATLTQQNTNLQSQVTALKAQNSTLITQNTSLQNQLNQINNSIAASLGLVQQNLGISIPGATGTQQLSNLVNAIINLNPGRKQGLISQFPPGP